LRGFDVINTQFQDVPKGSNVSFHVQNMLLPFPDAELARYDVVHARLLMYACKSEEWATVASNLSTLLRPGGYLFWEDTGYDLWNCVPATIAWTNFIILDQRASLVAGRDLLFASKLGRYFTEAGLLDITESLHSTFHLEDQEAKKVSALMLRLHEQSAKGAVERGGVDGLKSMDDVDSLVSAMRNEVQAGADIGFCLRRVIGRKT
jgi:SAM-dependent methyltransferase